MKYLPTYHGNNMTAAEENAKLISGVVLAALAPNLGANYRPRTGFYSAESPEQITWTVPPVIVRDFRP